MHCPSVWLYVFGTTYLPVLILVCLLLSFLLYMCFNWNYELIKFMNFLLLVFIDILSAMWRQYARIGLSSFRIWTSPKSLGLILAIFSSLLVDNSILSNCTSLWSCSPAAPGTSKPTGHTVIAVMLNNLTRTYPNCTVHSILAMGSSTLQKCLY